MSLLLSMISRYLLPTVQSSGRSCLPRLMGWMGLSGAYVVGGLALYFYLLPTLGEVGAFASIAGVLLGTSFLGFLICWMLKPKHTALTKANSGVEKVLSQMGEPLPLLALLAVAGITMYLAKGKAKES